MLLNFGFSLIANPFYEEARSGGIAVLEPSFFRIIGFILFCYVTAIRG